MHDITITPVRASVLTSPWPSWRVLSAHTGRLIGYVEAHPAEQYSAEQHSVEAPSTEAQSTGTELRYRVRRHSSDASRRTTIGDFGSFDDALASVAAR